MIEGITPRESFLVREKSKPAREPWRDSARGFVISESYLCFSLSRHTLSGMRSGQSQDSKSLDFFKVVPQDQELAACLFQRSRRESIVESTPRSRERLRLHIGGENPQAWSVAPRDPGHTDSERQERGSVARPATRPERLECNESGEAWAHNSSNGGIANHPRATYTAPGLPGFFCSVDLTNFSKFTELANFSPLSRRSQAIREQISDLLGLEHLRRQLPTGAAIAEVLFVFVVRECRYGRKEFARGVWGAELTSSRSRKIRLGSACSKGMPIPGFCGGHKTAKIRRD